MSVVMRLCDRNSMLLNSLECDILHGMVLVWPVCGWPTGIWPVCVSVCVCRHGMWMAPEHSQLRTLKSCQERSKDQDNPEPISSICRVAEVEMAHLIISWVIDLHTNLWRAIVLVLLPILIAMLFISHNHLPHDPVQSHSMPLPPPLPKLVLVHYPPLPPLPPRYPLRKYILFSEQPTFHRQMVTSLPPPKNTNRIATLSAYVMRTVDTTQVVW